jgi:hypothetical protein
LQSTQSIRIIRPLVVINIHSSTYLFVVHIFHCLLHIRQIRSIRINIADIQLLL